MGGGGNCGVKVERRGSEGKRVGSAGIRVNRGEKCGVRMDRRGVRRDEN